MPASQFNNDEAEQWLQVLPSLLDKADQGRWPVEAKLLYDLQKVCLEHERKLYALDLVEWLMSTGKRPIKRPLTSLQIVHITKHLRRCHIGLTMARVSDEDRHAWPSFSRVRCNRAKSVCGIAFGRFWRQLFTTSAWSRAALPNRFP